MTEDANATKAGRHPRNSAGGRGAMRSTAVVAPHPGSADGSRSRRPDREARGCEASPCPGTSSQTLPGRRDPPSLTRAVTRRPEEA